MARTTKLPNPRLKNGPQHRLRLGLFGGNQSGIGMTRVPERWTATWDDNLFVAQFADAVGMDFLLPVARWKGYGGATNPQGDTLETITWATALLASTRRIQVFATVHTPLIHPIFAAKQFVTADHVGHGRFGLNVVCGWNDEEFEMFGTARDHLTRYDQAEEWLDIVQRLWTSEAPFDYNGRFFKAPRLHASPKPWGGTRPVLVNAGVSPEGRRFALNNCDILFSTAPRDGNFEAWKPTIDAIRSEAADSSFPVYTNCVVTCRRTRREAEDFHRYCYENIDDEALDLILELRARAGRPIPAGDIARSRYEASKATAPYLVGDADDVASGLARLHAAGADGVVMMLTNQRDELPYIAQEVIPRLERQGLRQAFQVN